MKVLIAEDDFPSRKLLQAYFKKMPAAEIDFVVDGQEALEAFRLAWQENKPYDLILMDIMMPKLDGQESLRKIRDLEKEMGILQRNEVKVIMTSALGDPKNVVEAYAKGGATAYLVKPIQQELLLQEIKNLGF